MTRALATRRKRLRGNVSTGQRCLFVALVVLSGCSNRDIYDAVQRNQQLECQRYPDTRFEDCRQRSALPYDDYSEALQALDRDDSERF